MGRDVERGQAHTTPASRLKEALWQQLVRLAHADPAFRRRLETDPVAVLRASEVDVPPELRFVFVETREPDADAISVRSSGLTIYITLPLEDDAGITDEDLHAVVGGSGRSHRGMTIPPIPSCLADVISLDGRSKPHR